MVTTCYRSNSYERVHFLPIKQRNSDSELFLSCLVYNRGLFVTSTAHDSNHRFYKKKKPSKKMIIYYRNRLKLDCTTVCV